jgi:hypothetical protein
LFEFYRAIYRHVDENGKVYYNDKPPVEVDPRIQKAHEAAVRDKAFFAKQKEKCEAAGELYGDTSELGAELNARIDADLKKSTSSNTRLVSESQSSPNTYAGYKISDDCVTAGMEHDCAYKQKMAERTAILSVVLPAVELLMPSTKKAPHIPTVAPLKARDIRVAEKVAEESAEVASDLRYAARQEKPSVAALSPPKNANYLRNSPGRVDQLSDMATPLDPKAYSVLYETSIGDDILSVPRRDLHFKKANENLLKDVNADPELSAIMEVLVPGFRRIEGNRVPAKGISPSADVTWHHKPGSNKLQLVWRYQHEQSKGNPWNALWQELFHPNNRGGFADGKKNP